MAEEPLVEADIDAGRALVKALDGAGVGVRGAFWFYLTDVDRWKLMIVSDAAKQGSRDLYVKAISLKPELDLSKVEFVAPSSPIFAALSRYFRFEGLSGVRVSRNMLDGVYVDDAYVYRLAA